MLTRGSISSFLSLARRDGQTSRCSREADHPFCPGAASNISTGFGLSYSLNTSKHHLCLEPHQRHMNSNRLRPSAQFLKLAWLDGKGRLCKDRENVTSSNELLCCNGVKIRHSVIVVQGIYILHKSNARTLCFETVIIRYKPIDLKVQPSWLTCGFRGAMVHPFLPQWKGRLVATSRRGLNTLVSDYSSGKSCGRSISTMIGEKNFLPPLYGQEFAMRDALTIHVSFRPGSMESNGSDGFSIFSSERDCRESTTPEPSFARRRSLSPVKSTRACFLLPCGGSSPDSEDVSPFPDTSAVSHTTRSYPRAW